jgi:hypothetical protein
MPYGMGTLNILLRSIRSEEGPHYCLGAKREEAVKDKQQSTYSQVWISFGDFILGLYCVAWLMQESVSSRIFVRKKGMNHVQSTGRSQQTPSAKFIKEKTYH